MKFKSETLNQIFSLSKVMKKNGPRCTVRIDDGSLIQALAVNVGDVGQKTTLSLRPERVAINPPEGEFPNIFEAKVEELIYLGDHIRTRVSVCNADEFIIKVPNAAGHAVLEEGRTTKVGWLAEDCRALDYIEN